MDRNKTELTQVIQRNVVLWLDGHGFKPVESEVGVSRGWVADVAGVITPTQTELINLKLIRRPPRTPSMPYNSPGYEAANARCKAEYQVWKRDFEAIPQILTATVEVKTSVGDFRGDRKWTCEEWPTNLCYVALPEGLVDSSEMPKGWGVILLSQDGNTVKKVVPSAVCHVSVEQQLNVVLSIAVARDHATRYARLREVQRKERFDSLEAKTLGRIVNSIHFVRDVMRGVPIDRALYQNGLRAKLPPRVIEDLASLQPKQATTPNIAV